MIQVTAFGGHDGPLRYDRFFYLTIFGGCDLIRPTIARQLVAERSTRPEDRAPVRRPFFLTIFGGVDLTSPTLASEFLDLREMIQSGLLSIGDWDRAIGGLSYPGGAVGSITLFGGFGECELPSENEEIDSLGVQRHLGTISEAAGAILRFGIGQRDSERRATLRRALVGEFEATS